MKQKNKITLLMMLLIAASVLVQSCGKDNMKYPSSTIKGRLTYQGQPVGLVYANPDIIGTAGVVTSQLLFQQTKGSLPIYGVQDIGVYAKHDGTFASKFYNGEYTWKTKSSNPFEILTNQTVTVNGDTDMGNVEVVPYWWISNLVTTYTGGVFTATFNLTKPSTGAQAKALQLVAIYLSPTDLPDAASATVGAIRSFNAGTNSNGNVVPAAASTGGAVTIKVDLNTLTTLEKQNLLALGNNGTIWASVAVKSNTVTDALYSDPIKLQLP
jgi:hypothetical protein